MQFHTLRIALKQSLALLSWAILRLVEANDGERIEQWEKQWQYYRILSKLLKFTAIVRRLRELLLSDDEEKGAKSRQL